MNALRAAVAWLKSCPMWQKPQAAEDALEKALDVLMNLEKRIDALERGPCGEAESR